jgi:predicted GIY-YIG superfamily endonuclease
LLLFVIPGRREAPNPESSYNAKLFFVYLLASKRNGTLYLGVTHDLVRRTAEHKSGELKSFSSRYGVKPLVGLKRTTMPRQQLSAR